MNPNDQMNAWIRRRGTLPPEAGEDETLGESPPATHGSVDGAAKSPPQPEDFNERLRREMGR